MGMGSSLENGPGLPDPRLSSLCPRRTGFAWQCPGCRLPDSVGPLAAPAPSQLQILYIARVSTVLVGP